ncbi:MAG: hypothetical protein A2725_03330 [Candidatus Magasanikbacteria bacterium RIFCSPHIGHO2_01_FULL_33_34]|uniref:Uncharacterized protein n=1 Tax=Candidatus Magasanikbacteria bacterium RIFCSPHIGHO2_01_FULL_33_34 TaxID=1798671 RepID=A0A1F6LH24_9BACT|nr:MAG: hypothetical protein A2725_03330 [Candidatus Magasanikbacteria bacterium RIFCSPHIGHO2_01_FULL_33_34]OGH66161.1 MAG: hypothetical protein A3B83_00820 [Candidatus Magasanikbacteria bacterium RIFCSPHIGHO2_02_FULL_33_17]OGH76007.1 MAG: hypothetical protein A3A89_00730 [Candidatus Magasanikbacteria bacterium RIFCSPLOWO2_01_FULL_33_34]OGH81618.1 MAG: hypothetical protein A3F93_04780 [Candidatus Magasanikbacteria bacterium RIFCSPLOWO2_12_FULL_34_7]
MQKKRYIIFSLLFFISLGFFVISPVVATEDDLLGVNYARYSGLENRDIRYSIGSIIQTVLGFLGIGTMVLMLYAGFLWMTSMGNDEKVNKAKKIIWGASIGLAIIMSSYAITSFVLKSLFQATHRGFFYYF